MATKTKIKKYSRGQAARVEDLVDLNIVFSRAHSMFVQQFSREPDWHRTNTKLHFTSSSVICEIQEEG